MSPEVVTDFDLNRVGEHSRQAFLLEVTALGNQPAVHIPINVISGRGKSPTLLCIAGIHGDETNGVDALMELWAELNPLQLRGRVVMVPIANPTAFRARQRVSPLDERDLNREFPGRERGTPTERLAAVLFGSVVVPDIDFVFSLHSWYAFGTVLPHVEIAGLGEAVSEPSYRAAAAAGFKIIRASGWQKGVFSRSVVEAGIPAMEAEIGGLGVTQPHARERYMRHTRALMQFLGMGSMSDDEAREPPIVVETSDIISPSAGLLRLEVDCGDVVASDSLLATLRDYQGKVLQEIRASSDARVGAVRMTSTVAAGDHLFRLFTETDNPFAVVGG